MTRKSNVENEEMWRTISDLPKYEVSSHGNVRNKKTKRILKSYVRSQYKTVSIRPPGCRVANTYRIHRLVATEFIPNPNNYPQVNHLDGNKFNNNLENLEWCTVSMNIKHAYDTGLRGPIVHPYARPVKQIDKDGNVVATYVSGGDAYRKTNIRHIHEVVNHKRLTAGGYRWERLED